MWTRRLILLVCASRLKLPRQTLSTKAASFAGLGSFYLQVLFVSSGQVNLVLSTAREASSLRFPLSSWRVDTLASSIQLIPFKVYLSGVRAMHIEMGFSDPLVGFPLLCLQRVLQGIKRLRMQGSPSSNCLPITDNLMLVIWKSLDLHLPDHCMFWAAYSLAYFGFLRAAEFTVPSWASFSPLIHLGVQDISCGLGVWSF